MFNPKLLIKAGAAVVLCAAAWFGYAAHRAERLEQEEERVEQDGMEQAKLQQFMMLRDPQLNAIPTGRLVQADAVRRSLIANGRTASLPWQERGPSNIGGRTRALLVDRADPTGNTVLAGSVAGGIFRTTNFLNNAVWTPMDDRLSNMAISCLWQDRTNPSIMYAGTGEGWFNIDAVKGAGIFKSTDRGLTWAQIPSTAGFEYCQDLIQDLNGNLYVSLRNSATNNRGIMRSANGGASWTQVAGAPLTNLNYRTGRAADLEVASNGDLYATLGIFGPASVIKSSATNGAAIGTASTWVDVTPSFGSVSNRCELSISPSNPQRLYLFPQDSITYQVNAVLRSDDGGQSWFQAGSPTGVNNDAASQTWYNLISVVDPGNPDIVYAGGANVCRSTDGGNSWNTISTGMHVDQHELLINSQGGLLVGNDGGIFYTPSPTDGAPTFLSKNNTYNVTQFYGADFHPSSTNYFLAGAQDNQTQKFTGPGINATTNVSSGDGGIPHIDQTDGQLQIAAYVGNYYWRSVNGGTSFSTITGNNSGTGRFINPTDLDDVNNVLYAADAGGRMTVITGLTGTTSRGTRVISPLTTSRQISAVRVDPVDPTSVWIAGQDTRGASATLPSNLVRVTNANTPTPTSTEMALFTGVGNGAYVSAIEFDPGNAAHMLVTFSNYGVVSVWESTDGGNSFNPVEGSLPDMPVYWAMFVPSNVELNGPGNGAGGVMLGTDLGVWYTTSLNGTNTQWAPYANFPNTPVYMLKYRASDRLVLAATHGRGLWTTNLTLATGVSNVTATRDFVRYISTANDRLTIVPGTLSNVRRMTVEVYDSRGGLVHRETRAYTAAQLPISRWARGAYIVRITGDKGEVFVQQVVR